MTLTTEVLQEIYEAAVHSEASVSQEAEFELLCKLEDVGGTGATIRKLIDMVRAANREAQPLGYIDPANLKTYRGVMAGGSWSPVQRTLSGLNLTLPIYLSTPPAPAVPEGYCIMPLTLTAANGAKGALSGEFQVSRTVRCHECGGEGCDDCGDAGEFEEEITVPWDTIKDIYRAAVEACRAAMLAQPVSQGYKLPDGFKLMPLEMTDEIGEAIAMEARCCGGIALCIYEAALAAAPEGRNDA